MKDLIVPIVFPDYRIVVETPQTDVDLLPWVSFDNIRVPATKNKFQYLGHAGVLLVNGLNGVTKYYEYGRYDSEGKGLVRRVPLPDVKIGKGDFDCQLLKPLMAKISAVAGQGGRIEGVVIEAGNNFDMVHPAILARKALNGNPSRKPYSLTTNSCVHFVKWVVELYGCSTPWLIDPRPNSYMGEFRSQYPDIDFDPTKRLLTLEAA